MEIHFTKTQRRELTKLCKQNPDEVAGWIKSNRKGDSLTIIGYEPLPPDEIESATPHQITFNTKQYLFSIMYRALQNNNDTNVLIEYHTHPGRRGVALLSKPDQIELKENQKMIGRIAKR